MKVLLLLCLWLVFLSSCSSPHFQPPSLEVLDQIKSGQLNYDQAGQSERWAMLFWQAHNAKNDTYACRRYRFLAKLTDFPLHELAYIRSYRVCPSSETELFDFWETIKPSPWLKEEYIQVSLQKARQMKLEEFEARYSFEAVDYQSTRHEKEKLLLRAIELAEKNEDPRLKEYQEKLYEISPRYRTTISPETIFDIARDFEKNREFIKARKLYRKILKGSQYSFDLKLMTWERMRMSYKLQRNRPMYHVKTNEMIQFLKNNKSPEAQKHYIEYQIKSARISWTQDSPREAEKRLFSLLKQNVDSDHKANAYWLLASIAIEKKAYSQALGYLEKASRETIIDEELFDTIHWTAGWVSYLNKNFDKTIAHFHKILEKTKEESLKHKVLFWLGRTYEKRKDQEIARSHYEQLGDLDPFGYYGSMAQALLERSFTPIPTSDIHPYREDLVLAWLTLMGEASLAQNYLDSIKEQMGPDSYIATLHSAQWYDKAIFSFYKQPDEWQNEHTLALLPFIFPTPFQEAFHFASQESGMPQELLYAISRQESALNPHARSPADAFGLMQLIPEKANLYSRRLKIGYKDFNDLYQEKDNVRMGAALLGDLSRQYKNVFPFFIASYNAGRTPVNRWIKQRYEGDILTFIELIPYRETQKYVKLVARNMVLYGRLLRKKPFKLEEIIDLSLKK